MSYSMMLSQLGSNYKTMEDLKVLRAEHENNVRTGKKMLEDGDFKNINEKILDQERCIKEINNEIEERNFRELEKNLVVTNNHKKLLKEMYFKYYKEGGDYVFIGVDGKRPWGNSDMYRDIANILDWELPNDDLSDKQYKKAEQLIKELPIALNKILASLPLG